MNKEGLPSEEIFSGEDQGEEKDAVDLRNLSPEEQEELREAISSILANQK